jgi:PAS domain S-box-containing protein
MNSKNGLFESAFNFAPIGMAMVSLQGQCLKVNDALCELLGYNEQELLEISFAKITHPDDLAGDWDIVNRMLAGEMSRTSIEKRYIRKDGEIFWASLSVSISKDDDNVPQYFVSQVIDITDQKNAQMSLVYNSKMIALGEMAGTLIHEINNPLAIIGLNASSIAEAIKEEDINRHDINRFLSKINDTVMRINDITISLRKLSGKSEGLQMKPQQIKEVIQDALTFCFERFKAKGVRLETKIEDFAIHCKTVEISQVLINILNNAFYAVKDSTDKLINITAYADGEFGVIEICDSGNGIPEGLRNRIMEPFYTNKPIGEGTGLGLSICKKIIKSHNGVIYLSDKKKTTFIIKLPLIHSSSVAPEISH